MLLAKIWATSAVDSTRSVAVLHLVPGSQLSAHWQPARDRARPGQGRARRAAGAAAARREVQPSTGPPVVAAPHHAAAGQQADVLPNRSAYGQ